jgi:predicted O-methyltransferase YrrM
LILEHTKRLDYIFIDGNHQEEATLRYFNLVLPYCHNNTILIFDDINWSTGMQSAWLQIKEHPSVRATVDLYFMGIVFLREELSKEDFIIRF